MTQGPENKPGSVGEYLAYLLAPHELSPERCPPWPPDVFAVTATVLQQTGGYVRVGQQEELGIDEGLPERWKHSVAEIARRWRSSIETTLGEAGSVAEAVDAIPVPKEVASWWRDLARQAPHVMPSEVMGEGERGRAMCRNLLRLALVADEASGGAGWPAETGEAEFQTEILELLATRPHLESLCSWIRTEKARVLPKAHTPQRGLSLRSLTHHLALCSPGEVVASWRPHQYERRDVINLLLLPWPFETRTREFSAAPVDDSEWARRNRTFSFRRLNSRPEELKAYITEAIRQAKQHVDSIEMLVFPELSLTWEELQVAEELAVAETALLVGGTDLREGEWTPDFDRGGNVCIAQPAGLSPLARTDDLRQREPFSKFSDQEWSEIEASIKKSIVSRLRIGQRKHHRWCLDGDQILQYDLGGVLPVSKDCWESIPLGRRRLNFMTVSRWLTMTVLLCEDLAQQDPISDVLRSVGPNLVIALLMDGPQIRGRWASRYASVLADDPGSSVLTFTSLGMAARSRPRPTHEDRRRVFALWRDIKFGEQELEMPEGRDAAILSVACRSVEELSADGRSDGKKAYIPTFAGFYPLDTGTASSISRDEPVLED